MSALSSSLLQFRSNLETSTRDVEHSLQSSAADADNAVSNRRRDLESAVSDRVRAESLMRSAEAELFAAESELDSALGADPRYRGPAVSRARARVARAHQGLGSAQVKLRESEGREHEKRRLLERSENARRKIHLALDEYRSSVSAARAVETTIAMAALAKLSILKGILSTYLSSSSRSPSPGSSIRNASRRSATGGGTGHGGDSGADSVNAGTDPINSAREDRPIDWAAFSLRPDSREVQLAVLGPQLRRLLGIDDGETIFASGHEHEIWARRWVGGGAAMFRRDPSRSNFDARDLREGLSAPDSFGAMHECVTDQSITVDPVTGRLVSGESFLNALVAAGAEVLPLRFERGSDVD
ncbi:MULTISPECIES: hypothetical protein [Brevibacterium]|uniref:hypothetical protein n=1 Tax=Brevibacterium TaxID=1696 RepID=UPI0011BE2123|nr:MULTISPECIES: hypothetical protein [Brevibacterium]